jgi:hypothetical protein
MRWSTWMGLVAENGFRIHPYRVHRALFNALFGLGNSLLRPVQKALYGRQIAATRVQHAPLFILGHWRTGTTLLHELLALDEQLAYSTTLQSFAPHHCLITERFLTRFGGFLLPKRRPMDNMPNGWDRPQEDDFALLALGAPTPYRRLAFPNHPPPCMEFLDLKGVRESECRRWKEAMMHFVQLLTFRHSKRLVLKSPAHTGRVALLLELFPQARFIHLSRNPYAIFASTRRLWRTLDHLQGCQIPHHRDLDQYILESLNRMYRGHEEQSAAIPTGHLVNVRYEDLAADPVGQLREIYQQLDFQGFESVQGRVEDYARRHRDYQPSRYQLEPEMVKQVRRRWARYFRRYGYDPAEERVANLGSSRPVTPGP